MIGTIASSAHKIIPQDYVLAYDFNGNLLDKSINQNNGVGANIIYEDLMHNGRLIKTAKFNGVSSFVKSSVNLDLTNTDKISISFFCTIAGNIIFEHGINSNNINAFILNGNVFADRSPGLSNAVAFSYPSSFNHIVIICDRSKNATESIIIYINGVPTYMTFTNPKDINGVFNSLILFIGSRAGTSLFYNGNIALLKFYTRVLSINEIEALKDE